MWVRSLGRDDPLEEEMAAPSSILAWRNPWTETPWTLVGYHPWGHRDSDMTEQLSTHTQLSLIDSDFSVFCFFTGVGTRNYYRKIGYRLQGPYMVKTLE